MLRVIASSPTDLQRVLDAIADSAARLCDADGGVDPARRRRRCSRSWRRRGEAPCAPVEVGAIRPIAREARCRPVPSWSGGPSTSTTSTGAMRREYPEHAGRAASAQGIRRYGHRAAAPRGDAIGADRRRRATRRGRSPTSRSPCWRRSRTRPSSPSRTPGCSRSWSSATPNFRRATAGHRGAGAADRDGRGAAGDRLVADRSPARAGRHRRAARAASATPTTAWSSAPGG